MTTYVLGAGASRHAGYPLANELGDALVDWLAENASPVNERYGTNLRALRELYGSLRDLEHILTELEECPSGSLASTIDEVDRRHAISNLRIMIPEFFRHLREKPSSHYERLARQQIRSGDTVITFNYDLACERELKRAGLWEVGNGYGFSLGIDAVPQSQVNVLKLHGSTNWLLVAFGGMTGFFQSPRTVLGSRPVIFPAELGFLGYPPDLRDPLTPPQPAGAFPAIILPTFNKRFYDRTSSGNELQQFWEDLWETAGCALERSERIVMIGYSMAAADEKARQLLVERSNPSAHIEIFCGGSSHSIVEAFTAQGFRNIVTAGVSRFEDYLDGRASETLAASAN